MKITNKIIFLFGATMGAWLNIWMPMFGPWGGFVFAYVVAGILVVTVGVTNWIEIDKAEKATAAKELSEQEDSK